MLLLISLIYALFDFWGYNTAMLAPSPQLRQRNIVNYRIAQAIVFLTLCAFMGYLKWYDSLLGFLVYQVTFVLDAFYYLWAYILNPRLMENRYTVRRILRKKYILHARWSIVGLFTCSQWAVRLQVALGFLLGLLLELVL
ncbi:MAG: hypothetical protein QXO86_01440 [Nitrososphaerota archaeon]